MLGIDGTALGMKMPWIMCCFMARRARGKPRWPWCWLKRWGCALGLSAPADPRDIVGLLVNLQPVICFVDEIHRLSGGGGAGPAMEDRRLDLPWWVQHGADPVLDLPPFTLVGATPVPDR